MFILLIISIFVNMAFMVAGVIIIEKWPKVKTISDKAPEEVSPRNAWLKLQNEGKKYVKIENDTVYLKIVE